MALPTSRNQYLNQLFVEIDTDPNAYGYAPLVSREHQAIADILNEIRAEIIVTDRILTKFELLESVVPTEFSNPAGPEPLTDRQVQLWTNLLIVDQIDVNAGEFAAQLRHIWGLGTQTRDNLFQRLDRNGSRAEELWVLTWVVTNIDVSEAIVGGGLLAE